MISITLHSRQKYLNHFSAQKIMYGIGIMSEGGKSKQKQKQKQITQRRLQAFSVYNFVHFVYRDKKKRTAKKNMW